MDKIKISKLSNKSEARLKVMEISYLKKIDQLKTFKNISFDFDITLNYVQINTIGEKILEYTKKHDTIEYFRIWKYKHNCTNGHFELFLMSPYYFGVETEQIQKEIRKQRLRELKLENILS